MNTVGVPQLLLPHRPRPPHSEGGRLPPFRLHGRQVVPEEARGGVARAREVPPQGLGRERGRDRPVPEGQEEGEEGEEEGGRGGGAQRGADEERRGRRCGRQRKRHRRYDGQQLQDMHAVLEPTLL